MSKHERNKPTPSSLISSILGINLCLLALPSRLKNEKCWHLLLGINLRFLGLPSRLKKKLLAEDVIPNAALMLLAERKKLACNTSVSKTSHCPALHGNLFNS